MISEPVATIWYFWLSQTLLLSWLHVRQHHCSKTQALGRSSATGAGPTRSPELSFPGELGLRRYRHPGTHGRSGTPGGGCASRGHIPGYITCRGQPAGAVPGAAGAVLGCGGARQRPPPRSRPAPPGRGRRAPPGTGAGGAGRGGPEPARRDRPRPLLPAGEALKKPGEREPRTRSPDARADAPRPAQSRSAATAVSAATGGPGWERGRGWGWR